MVAYARVTPCVPLLPTAHVISVPSCHSKAEQGLRTLAPENGINITRERIALGTPMPVLVQPGPGALMAAGC